MPSIRLRSNVNAGRRRALARALAGLARIGAVGAIALGAAAVAQAQGSRPEPDIMDPGMVQITGLYGVGFGGSLDLDSGTIDLDTGRTFTVQGGLRVQDDGFAFLSYSRQSTVARFDSDGGPDSSFDLEVGYLLIGGELDLAMSRHFVPFIGLGIGTTYFKVPSSGERPDWYFSGMAVGGLKIPIVKNVGLRTQVRFLGTVINGDASWFCGVNGGATCAISLGDSSGIIQGDVTGGVYVAF